MSPVNTIVGLFKYDTLASFCVVRLSLSFAKTRKYGTNFLVVPVRVRMLFKIFYEKGIPHDFVNLSLAVKKDWLPARISYNFGPIG